LVEKTKRHGLTYLIENTEQKTEKEKHESKQKNPGELMASEMTSISCATSDTCRAL
jgi:hypothetical protein